MPEYRVKKDFPSRGTQIFHAGEIIELPKDNHPRTKVLLDNGYIEKLPKFNPKVIAVSKLAGVEIADRNYIEGDKRHFTFDEALEIEKKFKGTGWRLPTRSEWALICEEFGQENGILNALILSKALNLDYGGNVISSSLYNAGSIGYYWSSTANNASSAYNLYFSTSVLPSSTNYRYVGFSVRCVRDVDFGIGDKC